MRILVCNVNTETHVNKELLLKEINYSPSHVFLDVLDDVHSMHIVDFVDKCMDSGSKKKCYCHGL